MLSIVPPSPRRPRKDPDVLFEEALALEERSPGEAIELYRQVLDQNPDNADAYMNIGILESRNGNYDGACRNFRKALMIDFDNATAHFNLANCLEKDPKMLQFAIQHYHVAIGLAPQESDAYFNLGIIYEKKKEFPKAHICFTRFLKYVPADDKKFTRYARRHLRRIERHMPQLLRKHHS